MMNVDFPLYVLREIRAPRFVILHDGAGNVAMPLFTDLDFAVGYVARCKLQACVVALGDIESVIHHLGGAKVQGPGDVVLLIDPIDMEPGEITTMPCKQFVDEIRNAAALFKRPPMEG